MAAALLSDVHLHAADDPGQRRLVAFLDQLPAQQLYVLGDLFHSWWGYPNVVPAAFEPAVGALARCVQRGVSLFMVPGNHDFHLGPVFTQHLGAVVAAEHRLATPRGDLLLVHGDEADARYGYRVARALLRGPPFGALMRALGPERGLALGRRLAGSPLRDGPADPLLVQAQLSWSQRRLGEDPTLAGVVLGHSHAPAVHRLGAAFVANLGDFSRDGTWLLIDERFDPASVRLSVFAP